MSSDRPPVRFGVFEVNLETGEVRRAGVKVRLQEQPFQVLAALLEKPGDIVTKEELQERVWKDDTFVDFDRSLATAINKVRQALGDSATRPRFIETVPKRGYRFVGLGLGPTAADPEPSARWRPWAVVAAAMAILAGSAAWYFGSRETPVKWGDPVRITSDAGLTFQPTISPDGTLLAYSSDRDGQGNLDIYVQQTAGGGLLRLTDDPADDTAPDFSPDGKSVVFRSERGEGGVYVVPALGGDERLISAQAHRPRYSPDGEWFAYFTSGRDAASPLQPIRIGDAYVVPTAGGSPRPLVAPGSASFPIWSSDGSALLVYARSGLAPGEWRVVHLDGTGQEVMGSAGAVDGLQFPLAAHIPDHWDTDGYVYFSEMDAGSTDLWRIRIDPESARIGGKPERVLPGAGSYRGTSLAIGGRLVYASVEENRDVWSLEIDANHGIVKADQPVRLTSTPGLDGRAQVSQDGRWIVYRSDRSGKYEFLLLDSVTGRDRQIGLFGLQFFVLNAAGSRLVGQVEEGLLSILTLDGIVEKSFPFSMPFDWSMDETRILLGSVKDNQRAISLLEVESGQQTILLADPEKSLWQGQFSPDGRWIAWMTVEDGVQVARFQGAQPIPESDRIQISQIGPWADKPRWSPNGNLIYYTSDRDGFVCLYAQPLTPETKQPQGELRDVYHSHQTQLSITNVGIQGLWMDVAQDKIVFDMTELRGNIWMMDPVD